MKRFTVAALAGVLLLPVLSFSLTGCKDDKMMTLEEYDRHNAEKAAEEVERLRTEDLKSAELLTQDVNTLSRIKTTGTTPDFERLFGMTFTGENLIRWFQERVQSIYYERKVEGEPQLVSVGGKAMLKAGRAYAKNIGHKTIVVSDFYNQKTPWIVRMGLLIHEAQHTTNSAEGGHIDCPMDHDIPELRGKRGMCDPNERGSNVLEVVFIKNALLNCPTCERPADMIWMFQARLYDKLARIADQELRNSVADGIPAELLPSFIRLAK